MSSIFRFKKFSVIQDQKVFPIGTDAILLGSSCSNAASKVLEVGTGTGVIALILAQRYKDLEHLVAIDSDPNAVDLSSENFKNSPWNKRLHALHASLDEYNPEEKMFDLIVSNPPFYLDSLKTKNKVNQNAKHGDMNFFERLFKLGANVLEKPGLISLIVPTKHSELMENLAHKNALFLQRKVNIQTSKLKDASRVILEFGRTEGECLIENLIVMDDDGYSEQFKSLTKDLYLDH